MIRRYGLQIVILVLALVLMDAGINRRFPYDAPTPDLSGEPLLAHSPTRVRQYLPNAQADRDGIAYRTNALGFRDIDRSREKAADLTRILMVGDSFVEGAGEKQEDTIPVHLERRLSASLDRRVEVWNCGVSGASPAVYRWWAPLLAANAPDAVVIALSDSDLDDDARAVFVRDQYRARLWHALPPALRRSGLITHVTGAVASLRAAAVRLRLRQQIPADTDENDVSPRSLEQVSDPDRATMDWERSRHFLNQTLDALHRENIPVLVVHIPSPLTVPAKPGDAAVENTAADTPAFRHDLYADWLKGWAALSETSFVDLGPEITAWYQSAKNPPLYQVPGRHLNAAGLGKAAEWIEPELESLLLVHTAKRARQTIAP